MMDWKLDPTSLGASPGRLSVWNLDFTGQPIGKAGLAPLDFSLTSLCLRPDSPDFRQDLLDLT